MSNARNLARLLPDSSGKIQLPSQVAGVLPDANAPSGSVLQVVSVTKTDTFSTASNSFVDITGLSASITPSNASNKILVISHISTATADTGAMASFRLTRSGTPICLGDVSGSEAQASFVGNNMGDANQSITIGHEYSDSPATTSAVTYAIQAAQRNTTISSTVYINRDAGSGQTYNKRSTSTLILMEIAA